MKRLISILLVWLGLIAILNGLIHVGLESDAGTGIDVSRDISEDVDTRHVLYAVLRQAHNLAKAKDYIGALRVLEANTIEFERLPDNHQQLVFEYYKLKGHCHAALWQYVEAEAMWQLAGERAARSEDKKRINALVQMSRRAIDDMNFERNLKQEYHASPHVGPAAQLRGKVVLIYVFLADGALSDWSLRQREQVLVNWQQAQQWLSDKAVAYGSEIHFSQRIFVLNRHPLIKRLRVGDQKNNFIHSDTVAMLAARHFGFDSIAAFIDQIKDEEGADQAILIYHLARDGRSFASRCMRDCGEFGEFVFLMESPDVKAWQSLRYTQAHESLHLFGADDLYNISNAKYYAVRDIMNYPASVLDASTLEDLTAYAIGLREQAPDTPFRIRHYSTRR